MSIMLHLFMQKIKFLNFPNFEIKSPSFLPTFENLGVPYFWGFSRLFDISMHIHFPKF